MLHNRVRVERILLSMLYYFLLVLTENSFFSLYFLSRCFLLFADDVCSMSNREAEMISHLMTSSSVDGERMADLFDIAVQLSQLIISSR